MKLLYVGGGYVGLCTGVASADSGHEVLIYDIRKEYLEKLSSYDKKIIDGAIYEEGLVEMMEKNRNRLRFCSDLGTEMAFLNELDAAFICLPTPDNEKTGETDLKYYEQGCTDLAQALTKRNQGEQSKYVLVVNKSTVPIKMYNKTKEILDRNGVRECGVGASPEFLVEGTAMKNLKNPDRIVVGAWNEKDFSIFRQIFASERASVGIEYIEVNPIEASTAKLLANYMLFNRIMNCYDVVGRVCEKFNNLDFENIRKVLVSEKRLGKWGYYDSLFAGGSCFIKDSLSLLRQLEEKEYESLLVKDTLSANFRQLENFLNRPENELNFNWTGKKVALLGLSFKKDTDDIRNSGALGTTDFLIGKGVAEIRAYDPLAGDNFKKYCSKNGYGDKIKIADDQLSAMQGADVLIIATDWPEFRQLGSTVTTNLPNGALIMDGRRMIQESYKALSESGYDIIAVGSPLISNKLISVIITASKDSKGLSVALDSIIDQNYKNYEVILVDEKSSIDKKSLKHYSDRFEKKEKNLQIIETSGNSQHAKNAGLSAAKGEYILFCRPDAKLEPEMLSDMLAVLKSRPEASYVYSSFLLGSKLFKLWPFDLAKLKSMPCIDMTSLIRREHIPAAGWDESLLGLEDWDLWLSMLKEGHTGFWLDKVLYSVEPEEESSWLPALTYKVLPFLPKVKKYNEAIAAVKKKHDLN